MGKCVHPTHIAVKLDMDGAPGLLFRVTSERKAEADSYGMTTKKSNGNGLPKLIF